MSAFLDQQEQEMISFKMFELPLQNVIGPVLFSLPHFYKFTLGHKFSGCDQLTHDKYTEFATC